MLIREIWDKFTGFFFFFFEIKMILKFQKWTKLIYLKFHGTKHVIPG